MRFLPAAAALLVTVALSGCTYYRITDPHTGKQYYTNNWDQDRYSANGAVQFKDARTGSVVTLQTSEVEVISEEEFKRERYRPG
jgi:hypothetical protein